MKVFVLLFALLVVAFGDPCVTYPSSLSKDQNCSPESASVPCKRDLYCSNAGKCTPRPAAGEACVSTFQNGDSFEMCQYGSRCKGPIGSQVCVANASPSESCSLNPLDTVPYCGSGLSCVGGQCTEGRVGDKCFNSTHCLGGANCTNGACAFSPDGASCSSDYLCGLNSFCKSGVCSPLLGLGIQCPENVARSCANGAVCVGQSSLDTAVCVANQTREAGQYCGNKNAVCKGSLTCQNSFCAKQAPEFCYMNSFGDTGDCAADFLCLCGSDLGYGSGKCVKDSCLDKKKALDACAIPVCGPSYGNFDYSGACTNINCKTQVDALWACSPASALTASFSLVFFSLFISFFSKKF